MDQGRLPSYIAHILEDIRLEIVSLVHQDWFSPNHLLLWFIDKGMAVLKYVKRLNSVCQLILGFLILVFWLAVAIKIFQAFAVPSLRYASSDRMDEKTVLITGANRGRGLEVAKELASRGARIILACRNMDKGERAMQIIRSASSSERLSLAQVDFSDMLSVRHLANQVLANENKLDVLICNGSVALDRLYRTEDGLEIHFATNYLGFFLLSNLLLSLLSTSEGRILLPASSDLWSADLRPNNFNSELSFKSGTVFANSQLANLLLARELARRCTASRLPVSVNCFDAGRPRTRLVGLRGSAQLHNAVQTAIHLAASADGRDQTGQYFSACRQLNKLPAQAGDQALVQRLWSFSTFCTRLQPEESPV